MASNTHIFEDARPSRRSPVKEQSGKSHKRTPSVGAILRGRRLKENDPSQTEPVEDSNRPREKPLSERHINSPPSSQRIPLKTDERQSYTHKKTKSSVSLRSLLGEKKSDSSSISSSEGTRQETSPKKTKSTSNFAALLKKRSTKGLRDEEDQNTQGKENSGLQTPLDGVQSIRSPIWEQFASQPFEDSFGRALSPDRRRNQGTQGNVPHTPNRPTPGRLNSQLEQYGYGSSDLDEKPPQRPFLQHKSSRSSIFKEESVDEGEPVSPYYTREESQSSFSPDKTRPWGGSRQNSTDHEPEASPKRASRVMTALTSLATRNKETTEPPRSPEKKAPLSPQEIDAAFETVLESRNIPHNMRDRMRSMDLKIKADFVKSHRVESSSSQTPSAADDSRTSRSPLKSQTPRKEVESRRPRSKSRTRAFTLTRGDKSPSKKTKSEEDGGNRSRPKSIDISRPGSSRSIGSASSHTSLSSMSRPESANSPADFLHYLREVQKPELVEIGKIHKLRILLRNESVAWTDSFITDGGMDEVVGLLYRTIQVEWREEHEDTLLHEVLLCLKGLSTTELALTRLAAIADTLFPKLLSMLFDPERKGPAEFSTRSIIISLLFMHLSSAVSLSQPQLASRARRVLSYLEDPKPEESKQPLQFISQMHVPRPYRVWTKEIVNVTKEVFWIFLHHLNVIPLQDKSEVTATSGSSKAISIQPPITSPASAAHPNTYLSRHFPAPPPPHPAAPYVGGVEWEATLYLAAHMDLLNGLIASLPSCTARNALRQELKDSSLEKVMGGTMRTSKEKFYGHLHQGLRCWVRAGVEDGWDVQDVREGPVKENSYAKSPSKGNGSPKKALAPPPKLDLKIEVGGGGGKRGGEDEKGWL